MSESKLYIYILSLLFIIINLISFFQDDDLLGDLYKIGKNDRLILGTIVIDDVYSNSIGFDAQKEIPEISSEKRYMIKNLRSHEIIYFKVNTIKKNNKRYFLQHIDWITKRKRKIPDGTYDFYEIK